MEIRDCIADDRLNTYLDGEMTPDEQTTVKVHLDQCPRCRTRFENMRLIGDALRTETLKIVENADFSGMWGRIRAEAFPAQPVEEPRRSWLEEIMAHTRTVFAPLAAAAALLVIVALYFMTKPLSPPSAPVLEAIASNETEILSLETDSPVVTVLQSPESGATIIVISDNSTETDEETAI